MLFKAIVKDKETGKRMIIEAEYRTRKECIEDLRRNGYSFSDKKVREAKLFDHIMYELGKCNNQYEMNLVWKIKSLDETYKSVLEADFAKMEERLNKELGL